MVEYVSDFGNMCLSSLELIWRWKMTDLDSNVKYFLDNNLPHEAIVLACLLEEPNRTEALRVIINRKFLLPGISDWGEGGEMEKGLNIALEAASFLEEPEREKTLKVMFHECIKKDKPELAKKMAGSLGWELTREELMAILAIHIEKDHPRNAADIVAEIEALVSKE